MFNSIEFITAWNEWKEHKGKIQGRLYTEVAERKALATLFKKCDGREDLAIASIDYSIDKNWADIYLKPTENGTKSVNGSDRQSGSQQRGTSTDRMEAASKW